MTTHLFSDLERPAHAVRLAVELPRARHGRRWFVVECACGWSSRLYGSELLANEAYAKHKEEAPDAAS